MPPELTAALAALAVQASPDDFAAAERLLGGSFSGLADIRRNPVAMIDAAELTSDEITDRLSGLPIGPDAELHVAWIAERLGARMSFATFAANVGDLWFPRNGRHCLRSSFRWSAPGPLSRSRGTHHALHTGSITGGAAPRT